MTNPDREPDAGEVGRVAAKLTRAQRKALLEEVVRDGDKLILRWQSTVGAACRCALQRQGLWEAGMYNTAFTPLGLALRAHLRSLDRE